MWTFSIRYDLDEAGSVGRAEADGDIGEHPSGSHGPNLEETRSGPVISNPTAASAPRRGLLATKG